MGRRSWLAGAASLLAPPVQARVAEVHPLAGQKVEFAMLGVAEWHPSTLVREMAPDFAAYAKAQYGYEVAVRYEDAPFAALYAKEAASLAGKAAEFNLVIADSQWLGAFASEKWILPLNPIIEANKELDVAWYAPQVRDAYQLFPDGSNNRWGMPQAGDVLALFVRRDLLTGAGEAEAFKTKYNLDLPQSWEDFEKLTWDDYVKVLDFFNRPAQGYHGFASHLSAEYDYFSCPALSFMLGRGGQLWDAKSGQVEGILNTDANAQALEQYVSLIQYQPEAMRNAAIGEVTDAFTSGRVFSALQWAGAGPSMIPEAMRDKVMVVPPPGFKADGEVTRNYVIGGQLWALNDRNDEARTQVAIDFLRWWYRPETALDFAKRGGMPCDMATLSQAEFDGLQPWFRTYKYMLKRSSDFWHDPKFAELLAAQQAGFTMFASGKVTDARLTLDLIACRQQTILFAEGSAERRPSEACRSLQR